MKGIKYTGRDFYACQRLKRMLDKETVWFAGCDELLIAALSMGDTFSGGIGLNYNIIPRHFARICELCAKNDFRAAAKWQAEANMLVDIVVDAMKDNWSAFKVLMKGVGIDCGCCRAPYAPLTKVQEHRLLDRFIKLGLVNNLPPFDDIKARTEFRLSPERRRHSAERPRRNAGSVSQRKQTVALGSQRPRKE